MFQLLPQDIHLAAKASDKIEAIFQVAAALTAAGYVDATYAHGMIEREQQNSTYLGKGIAIPHGTIDTRNSVLKTGIQIFQFPQGIEWGVDQTVYVVIGIAARTDEHLDLLRRLTHILSDDAVVQQITSTKSVGELRDLLMGTNKKPEIQFDSALIALDVAADNLITLQALNAGRLQQRGAVDAQFVGEVVAHSPLYLGQGIWLNDSAIGNLCSAVAISRPANPFQHNGETVALLLTLSVIDEQPRVVLSRLSDLLLAKKADALLNTDVATLLALLTSEQVEQNKTTLSAEFIIRNEHGLHARPGAMLINTIKQFTSEITITNLDCSGKPAKGRSLMKVVALGVKKGHRLRFTASGGDAQAALDAIGQAIASGLGEGVA